jgi:hypothetical protein
MCFAAQCWSPGPLLAEREGYFLCSVDAVRLARSSPVGEFLRDSFPVSFGVVSAINCNTLSDDVNRIDSSLGETRLQGQATDGPVADVSPRLVGDIRNT